MRKTQTFMAVAAVLLVVRMLPISFSEDPAGHVPSGQPPVQLAGAANLDGFEYLGTYGIFGRPGHVMLDKKVKLTYFATSGGINDSKLAHATAVESTTYWPTSVAVLGPSHIAVAGKGLGQARNHTVIEIWKVKVPMVLWALNPATGQVEPSLENVGVLSKTQVYSEATSGRDIVRGMVSLRGNLNAMLVHFYDSGDLYRLDYGEAIIPSDPPPVVPYPLTKVLRATPGTDVPVFSALGDKSMLWISGATHQTQGAVYAIWPAFDIQLELGDAAPLQIAMYDHDMDGDLDAWSQPTHQENLANGMLDDALYSEKFLRTSW